jgi:hypothetical protein
MRFNADPLNFASHGGNAALTFVLLKAVGGLAGATRPLSAPAKFQHTCALKQRERG